MTHLQQLKAHMAALGDDYESQSDAIMIITDALGLTICVQSENIGTAEAPLFECVLTCHGKKTSAKDPSEAAAKRAAAQTMLGLLAAKHGAEGVG